MYKVPSPIEVFARSTKFGHSDDYDKYINSKNKKD